MPDVDLNTLISALVGGGAGAWGAIKVQLYFIWRDIGRLEKRVGQLEKEVPKWQWARRQMELLKRAFVSQKVVE